MAWLALLAVITLVTGYQFIRLGVIALTDPDLEISGGGLVLAFLITVVWLLTMSWFALGAWRRSVWGCPFEHTTDAPMTRRCERHELVPPPQR